MSRMLSPLVAAVLSAGLLSSAMPQRGVAQSGGRGPAPRQPAPRQDARHPAPGQPGARQPASRQPVAGQPPVNQAGGIQDADLRVPDVPPELERLLDDWSRASARITELQGEHGRIVYDHVFQVSKHSTGHFYFKGPDKGRIDLNPVNVKPGDPDPLMRDQHGRPYTLQLDQKERWICNGETIWRIDDTKKEAEAFPIPEESRGRNIMDGPLPFLFGLPPEAARRRFEFTIEEDTPEHVRLHVRPRLRQDAANWSSARVILLKPSYLPRAVQINDPSGNEQTVYEFKPEKLKVGPQRNLIPLPWGQKDPFDPDLPRNYEVKHHKPPEDTPVPQPNTLPSVIGLHGLRARNLLAQLGCEVKFVAGEVAGQPEVWHTVYQQQPPARTPFNAGQTVVLTYYVTPPQEQPPPERQAAGMGEVPSVRGVHWEQAQATLQQAGFEVEFLKGRPASRQDLSYVVYEQQPAAGTALARGGKVTLTVYLEPAGQ